MPRPARHLELLSAANSGDEERKPDTDAVFRVHARRIGGLALRLLGRPDEVDDLVQDVFLDAHRGLRSLRDPASVGKWLTTLTIRKARSRLRRRWLWQQIGWDDAPSYARVDWKACSPEDRTQLVRLLEVLDSLQPQARLAWILRHVEGHTFPAIAEQLGCSLSTAKRRLADAEAALTEVTDGD